MSSTHNGFMGINPTNVQLSETPIPHEFKPLTMTPTPTLQRLGQAPSPACLAGLLRVPGRSVAVAGLAAATVLALTTQTPVAQRVELLTWLVMAPLCEEAFFRGLLHEALLRRLGNTLRGRQAMANALVALAFAALHTATRGWATGVAVIVPALLIGQIYGRSRRLLPAVALHASFNLAWLAWGQPGAAAFAAGAPVAQDFLSILQEWFA